MASDPVAAAKYEKFFAEMSGNAERVEKFAQENNDEILGAGRWKRYADGFIHIVVGCKEEFIMRMV